MNSLEKQIAYKKLLLLKNGHQRKKQMFNQEEVDFIEKTALKDLTNLSFKIEDTCNQMARLGKNLSELKIVQSHLTSILQAIKEDKENE